MKPIPGATPKGMIHLVKGCMFGFARDIVLLHCGTNDLKKRPYSSENRTEHMKVGRRGI